MKSISDHWDTLFSAKEDCELGWYESDVSKTMELLEHIDGWKNKTIFLPGAGTSILVEELLSHGPQLILNDISNEALHRLKQKLADDNHQTFWLCQDIAQTIQQKIPDIDIWIDRAVLHFLTDEKDIQGYFNNVRTNLKIGGYGIFAEFSTTGAEKCAGLTLHRYSVEELSRRLGDSFELVYNFDHIFINPRGEERPYIYTLFKRIKA